MRGTGCGIRDADTGMLDRGALQEMLDLRRGWIGYHSEGGDR